MRIKKEFISERTWKEYQVWVKEQLNLKKTKKKFSKVNNKKNTKLKKFNYKLQYKQQLETPQWKMKRSLILKRDSFKCVLCDSKQELQVHHIRYIDGKQCWEYENSDLITLCGDCHRKVHKDKTSPLNPINN